jgi:hypothetical protein
MTRIEESEHQIRGDHRYIGSPAFLPSRRSCRLRSRKESVMGFPPVVTSFILMLASCGHVAVVGIEPRGGGDPEFEIVGPIGAAPTACENPRFVDEPTTPYAIDVRCAAMDTSEQ